MNSRIKKKAQEEMVGFVLIVVIVVVIALIFMALYLRKPSEAIESKRVENFLSSFILYTSNCSFSGRLGNIEDLAKSCYLNRPCDDGTSSCIILNKTIVEVTRASWQIGENRPIRGYNIDILYQEDSEEPGANEEIMIVEEGNCTRMDISGASQPISMPPGNIYIDAGICYSKA